MDLTLGGAEKLATTAADIAEQLRSGALDGLAAAEEVIGYITHPRGTPAGVASDLRSEATPVGFALSANADSDPFLTRFLTEPFDVRSEAVADQYAEQLEQLIETTLQGA